MSTQRGELGCPNCDGPCLGCWDKGNATCHECQGDGWIVVGSELSGQEQAQCEFCHGQGIVLAGAVKEAKR